MKKIFMSVLIGALCLIVFASSDIAYEATITGLTGRNDRTLAIGNYLYVCNSNEGLVVYDITNKTSPVKKSASNDATGRVHGIAWDGGDYIFTSNFEKFNIYNISSRANPVKISSLDYNNGSYDLLYNDNYLYHPSVIIDVSDRANPVVSASVGQNGYTVFLQADTMYIGNESGLICYDVSNKSNVSYIGDLSNKCVVNVAKQGDYLIVADMDNGLYIYDASDIFNLIEVSHTPNYGTNYGIPIQNNYCFFCPWSSNAKLRIVDFSDVNNPFITDSVSVPLTSVYQKSAKGGYCYLSDYYGNVGIVDYCNVTALKSSFLMTALAEHGIKVQWVTDGYDELSMKIQRKGLNGIYNDITSVNAKSGEFIDTEADIQCDYEYRLVLQQNVFEQIVLGTARYAGIAVKDIRFENDMFNSAVRIFGDIQGSDISVYSVNGNRMDCSIMNNIVDVSSLPAGNYILHMSMSNNILTHKFEKF